MFLFLLWYELLNIVRSRMALLVILFISSCMMYGLWNGKQRLNIRESSIDTLLQAQRDKFENFAQQADSIIAGKKEIDKWWTDPTNPLVVGEFSKGGRVIAMPSQPLNALSVGMSDVYPEAVLMKISQQQTINSSDFENPFNLSVGVFDFSFVITFILPLFIIALTFNLVSAEREQGTMALLLSLPFPAKKLFLLKMLARFSLLSALILLLFFPLMYWGGISIFQIEVFQAASLILLYALFWFLISLIINLFDYSSAYNALANVGAWLIFTLIVPATVNQLAERLHPIPSRAGYLNDMRTVDKVASEREEEILRQFYDNHPELKRKPDEEKEAYDSWMEHFALMDYEQQMTDRITDEFDARVQAQASFVRTSAMFSPAMSFTQSWNHLSGTGRTVFENQQDAIKGQHQKWAGYLRAKYANRQALDQKSYEEMAQIPERITVIPEKSQYTRLWGLLLAQCALLGMAIGLMMGSKGFTATRY